MSVLEAMARGIPTVATPVGGIPQVINDGVDGVLIPVDNHQALAVALSHLLESSELRKEMGSLARKKDTQLIRYQSTLERNTRHLLQCYQR